MNLFAPGAQIVAALKQAHEPEVQVFEAGSFGDVLDRIDTAPAFHVLYGGDTLNDGQGQPVAAARTQPRISYQVWDVVCVVRNLEHQYGGGGILTDAGEMIGKAADTLKGMPVTGTRGLRFARLLPFPHELPPGTGAYIASFELTLPV
jgi:hypothetical protein